MTNYRITNAAGIVVADGLTAASPSIRLDEGTPEKGMPRPLDLAPGCSTRVVYPLLNRRVAFVVSRASEDGSFCEQRQQAQLPVAEEPAKARARRSEARR